MTYNYNHIYTFIKQNTGGRKNDDGGYGMERSHGRQSLSTGKSMDAKETKAIMKDYLKSSRNPNLKLGKIKDAGNAFEAEIMTRNNALVDNVLIDKTTGSVRSAY